MTDRRSPANLPAARAYSAPARCPQPEEPELLERELARIFSSSSGLFLYNYPSTEKLKKAVEQAQLFTADNDLPLLAKRIKETNRPASKDDIASAILLLMGSFVTSRSELEIRAKMMAGDIGAQAPGWFAIDIACRKLRRTLKFAPMISEVLEAIKQAESEIDLAVLALEKLPMKTEAAAREIEIRTKRETDTRERQIEGYVRRLESGKEMWDRDCFPDLVAEAHRRFDERHPGDDPE
jgi:hypothetical protein